MRLKGYPKGTDYTSLKSGTALLDSTLLVITRPQLGHPALNVILAGIQFTNGNQHMSQDFCPKGYTLYALPSCAI